MLDRAIEFAHDAHRDQKRKYHGTPYISHPLAVMEIVKSVPGHTEAMLAAAVLHDVVEDTQVVLGEITALFGNEVGMLVDYLTDRSVMTDGNRKVRKEIDRNRLATAPAEAQTIKVADLIHNTADISQHAPGFWQIYKVEKQLLLDVLDKADTDLWHRAHKQITELW
mgnify:FL=1